jgi:7-carboxy-7-deazaguanine synthase
MSATTLPLVEVFGPTIQGEGPDGGRPAYFVRFGGCDYRCAWCDTPYAVEPERVRTEATFVSPVQVLERLELLPDGPSLVVLTGGNPALLELGPLVELLQDGGFRVAVETQGSIWRPWLGRADRLVVSPKPPSSGMCDPERLGAVERFLARAGERATLKIVIFDQGDLDFAEQLALAHRDLPLYLSVGTDQALDEDETRARVLRRLAWLSGSVARRPGLASAHVLPQLHVLAWGTRRGV